MSSLVVLDDPTCLKMLAMYRTVEILTFLEGTF